MAAFLIWNMIHVSQLQAYLGLSKSGFREKWDRPGSNYPKPAREAGRIFWSRRQLDAWIVCQFG